MRKHHLACCVCALAILTQGAPAHAQESDHLIVRFAPETVSPRGGRSSGAIETFNFSKASVHTALVAAGVEHMERLFPDFVPNPKATNIIGEPITLEDLSLYYIVRVRSGYGAASRLRAIRGVTSADYPKPVTLLSPHYPNDNLFAKQWGMHNDSTLATLCPGYSGPARRDNTDINAPEAWAIETGDSSVRVGVIDSGIDADHEDFGGRVVPEDGISFVPAYFGNECPEPCPDQCNLDSSLFVPDDDRGHGTMVAGVIAASGDNTVGIAGVAWGITPIPIKILNRCCEGGASCNSARAMNWAREQGIPILNMSYETGFDLAQLAAVRNAFYSGQLLVAAAGNYDGPVGTGKYPASHTRLVCGVGAYFINGRRWVDSLVTHNGEMQRGSTYGPHVDLAAPGGILIASTRIGGTNQYADLSNCSTGNFGGTSAATPVVSGVAALIRSAYSAHGASGTEPLLGEDLYEAMVRTARNPDGVARDDSTGFGHVLADSALKFFASPREIYHKSIRRPEALVLVDTFTSTRTLRHFKDWNGSGLGGGPWPYSDDSTFTVTTYVMRRTSAFSPRFSSTPIVWARSSGSVGARDTNTYDYREEVNYGKIVSATTDSVTVEARFFKIIGVSSAYQWFPTNTFSAVVALTAVGVPVSSPSIRNQVHTPSTPAMFALRQNRPNPFSTSTQIEFDLPSPLPVRLEIFDAQGRSVRVLADRSFPAGTHRIEWDHMGKGGRPLGAGVYLYRIKAGSFEQQKKMLLMAQ